MFVRPHVDGIFADHIVQVGCPCDQNVIFEAGVHKCEYAINGFQMPHHLSVSNICDCIVGKEMEPRWEVNNSSWALFACETVSICCKKDPDSPVYMGFILHHCSY